MKKLIYLIIVLILLLSIKGIASAGDSVSIGVSFAIPAIPGINAPSLEEKTMQSESTQDIILQEEIKETQEEVKTNPSAMIQESVEKETLLAKEKDSSVFLETIYSR